MFFNKKIFKKRTKKIEYVIEKINVRQTSVLVTFCGGDSIIKRIDGLPYQYVALGWDEYSEGKLKEPEVGILYITDSTMIVSDWLKSLISDHFSNINDYDKLTSSVKLGQVASAIVLETKDHFIDYAVAKVVDV